MFKIYGYMKWGHSVFFVDDAETELEALKICREHSVEYENKFPVPRDLLVYNEKTSQWSIWNGGYGFIAA